MNRKLQIFYCLFKDCLPLFCESEKSFSMQWRIQYGCLGCPGTKGFLSLAKESTELQTIMGGGGHYSGHTQIKILNITLLLDLKKYWKNGLWKYKGALFISKLYLKIPPPTLFSSNTAPLRARKTVLEEDPLYFFTCLSSSLLFTLPTSQYLHL